MWPLPLPARHPFVSARRLRLADLLFRLRCIYPLPERATMPPCSYSFASSLSSSRIASSVSTKSNGVVISFNPSTGPSGFVLPG